MSDDSSPIPLPESEDEPASNPSTIAAINARFKKGSERMDRFEEALRAVKDEVTANTKLTRADHDMTAEIREIVVMGRRFFFYLGKVGSGIAISASWLRKALLWIGPPIAIVAAAWHSAGDSIKAWFHWGGP